MSINNQVSGYSHSEKFYLAVDCIIFGFDKGKLKLLVFKRDVDPLRGEWSLLGSLVKENENVGEAANRVLHQLTGLKNVFLKELRSYSEVDRDPGARCISISHYSLIRFDEDVEQMIEEHGAHWFEFDELPALILDHDDMVKDALTALKNEARRRPIGFELLPEQFTIPQLQSLYEAIYGTTLDSRNFRKKVLSFNVLQKSEDKDFSTSKKGAFLYRFDEDKYNELVAKGFDFVV
ncbi:MAG: DNA mismatch repair protein MutT [Cytophagaceae bacterium]|nr:DNA mismatch repair protein MutT [Cytophagaceae bacterium]|tara:strand:+ start:8965 stop:9669 length:705 start_codon:yes stop_codon:yes gene_type:complete